MKISTSLKIAVVLLLSFSLISAASVLYQLDKMVEDSNIINNASGQKAISQRLAKFVHAQHHGIDTTEDIMHHTARLDRIVNGLINGDAEWGIPKATDEKFIAKMKEVEDVWQKYKETMDRAKADPAALRQLYEESENFLRLADESVILAWAILEDRVKALIITQTIIFVLSCIILTGIWIMSIRKIASPLQRLTEDVKEISKGNLKANVTCGTKGDEINTLSCAMETMVISFGNMTNSILTASNNVVSTVDTLRVRADKTLEGAKNQSSQAHQIATAAEEMSQTITDIAKNASVASESSSEAMEIAESGKQITDTTVETISEVNTSTAELSKMVDRLNSRVVEIGGIVTVIKGIADQTNLLALNAAIEAARAGDQGRGFAVVADEVRKLAERTVKATTEITDKIEVVQSESEQTSKSMSSSTKGIAKAVGHVRNLKNVLDTIVESVQKVRDQITQIATAVDEQSAASEEVSNNIEKTSIISRDMERMAGDVMHHVNALTKISDDLRRSTAGFKT